MVLRSRHVVHCLAVPQLQFITVVDTPFRCAGQFPMVLFAQKTIEIPQFVFGGRCPCLQVFHRCSRGWTVQTHSCSRCRSASVAGCKFHRCGL